ncbi:MAG: (d)CMP kinase [Bacteriovoracaceae bacterium]
MKDRVKDRVIAIDGPSGSGKSTITKLLANELNFTYLDTGAMFRALAYKLDQLDIDFSGQALSNEDLMKARDFLESLDFQYAPSKDVLIKINGEDLSQKIREHHVSRLASQISKFPVVREYLAKIQKDAARERPSILEGRDIGTVIFPNAALKFFLTADNDVRARRRLKQLRAKGAGGDLSLEQIKKDIEKRDQEDSRRETAPLKKAEDAIVINTSALTIEETINQMIQAYKRRQELFK